MRDRIDSIIAHEYEESRNGTHLEALEAAAKTELPVTDGARRLLRAMARQEEDSSDGQPFPAPLRLDPGGVSPSPGDR